MVRCRSFRNTDPPALAHLWNMCWQTTGNPLRLTPINVDRHVLGKLHFDPAGLLLAFCDDAPLGFAHVGFGPKPDENDLDYSVAILWPVVVPSDHRREAIATALLEAATEYALRRGATTLFCGGGPCLEPFWLALAAGPRTPGIPDNDLQLRQLLESRGFSPVESRAVFSCLLERFPSPTSPEVFRHFPRFNVVYAGEPPLRNWWELVTLDPFELSAFELINRSNFYRTATMRLIHRTVATDIGIPHPLALLDISPAAEELEPGVTAFFLIQVARDLSRARATRLEIQFHWPAGGAPSAESEAIRSLLGMELSFRGTVFRRDLVQSPPGSGLG